MSKVAESFPKSGVWQFLGYETDHAAWRGCTLWDLIQPSFMFMVGVALPFSVANRQGRGDSFGRLFLHALWRAFALVVLGIFLASGKSRTDFNFVIVLSQIGLGYPILWLLAWTRPRIQFLAACGVLLFSWAVFALYPLPPKDFDFQAVGVPPTWQHFQGFEAHWEKNANAFSAFDQWFMNLFPRDKRFVYNNGGYTTLNFVPSLGTMIFGLLAGGLLLGNRPDKEKLKWMLACGAGGLLAGWAVDALGLCPMVKRIWTPSFAIYSSGWAFLMLAVFFWLIEMQGYRRWAFPLKVAGMNSIALYCMSMQMKPYIRDHIRAHFGQKVFEGFGVTYAPMVEMASILMVLWLVSWWMYRRKIFLRI
jgi:predicted acyltransferase